MNLYCICIVLSFNCIAVDCLCFLYVKGGGGKHGGGGDDIQQYFQPDMLEDPWKDLPPVPVNSKQ